MTPTGFLLRRPQVASPALAGALTVALLLGGCGTAPAPSPPAPAATPPVVAPADPWARGLADFEARRRTTADAAIAAGRWGEAVAALEVLRALHPDDRPLGEELSRARAAAESAARERLQRGRAAQQRNDTDAAARAYLDALLLWPALSEAADALRAIERERVRRQQLGRLSSQTMGSTAGALQAEPLSNAVQNEIEHASLLADQGEFDEAIATLKPLAEKRSPDKAVVSLLANVYYRQAEALGAARKAAAIAALERCLKLDRNHAAAQALLKQLKAR